MRIPEKSSLPYKQEWSKEAVWNVMDYITTKTKKREGSIGELRVEGETDTSNRTKRVPLGQYGKVELPGYKVSEVVKEIKEKGMTSDREFDNAWLRRQEVRGGFSVSIYMTTVGDYVKQLYPVPGEARTEYAVGLSMYIIAHELGHKYHLEDAKYLDGPPVEYLMGVNLASRKELVAKSIPKYVKHANFKEIENTPLGERLQLRQSYLAGEERVLTGAFPTCTPKEIRGICGEEFTAHMSALTSLGECVELGKLPPAADNVRQHIVASLLDMNQEIENLPDEEKKKLYMGLRWLETDGKTVEGVPLLADTERLQRLLIKPRDKVGPGVATIDMF